MALYTIRSERQFCEQYYNLLFRWLLGMNMLEDSLGADKGYHTRDFVRDCRDRHVTPHVADKAKHSMLDGRTTSHPGYGVSQRIRKPVEEIFGWAKTVGAFRRTRFRGSARTQMAAYIVGAAYNLTRMSRMLATPT